MKLRSKKIAKFLAALLAIQLVGVFYVEPVRALTSAAECNTSSATTSLKFNIQLQSNPIFYFDSAKSITAGYIQVTITNKTGATVSGYKARIERTDGTVLNVNANEIDTHPFLINTSTTAATSDLANDGVVNAYWYMTAVSATTADQKFNIVIVDSSNTDVCKKNLTITETAETIAASSNKVTSVSYSDLAAANSDGSSTFTATVKGQTGTIGAGPSGTSDVNMSPATKAAFAAGNYRLSATDYTCNGTTVSNKLYIANACAGNYTAVFTYQYINSTFAGGVDKAISPIMQIASGTQMKHTAATTFTIAEIGAPSTTTNNATSVSSSSATLNGVVNTGTMTSVYFCRSTSTPIAHACTDTVTATVSGSNYTFNWTGLSGSTTYYFEIVGESGGTPYYGGEKSFKTLATGAIDTTTAASSITTTSATLNGSSSNLSPASSSDYYFLITDIDPGAGNHLDPSVDDTVTATMVTGTPNTYSASATGLTAGTKYYYELIVIVSGAYYYGGVLDFTTTAASSPAPPVYVPHPPTITSISAAEVCAITPQLEIKGTWLTGATAKVDGVAAQVLASSQNEMTVVLPSAPVGTKTITVTNADGSATTTVKYAFADTPIYVNYVYPETYKDRAFSYVFKAIDAAKYEISGVMPSGLVLNPLTGELSGAPTQEGDFVFQIIASNICASTTLIVYMFVDKAIPTAFTCSVAFNVPASNNISDIKLANLKNCLSKTSTLSPKYINPVIFISGGLPAGLTSDQALTHPRYLPILDVILSMNLNAQIYYGAFNGSTDSVQLNVYWPDPS